ncbi:hypothetical protein DPMN_127514 [Dreissena polymorpha]|uniref:Uncharacterized protein n=1 Tax=Dreissena polymorpha TaxID=45954 RepID=A0A9D4JZ81_DREPO|nr:hypothetical protein DPMN_127514 [Dreissena polymorpha]
MSIHVDSVVCLVRQGSHTVKWRMGAECPAGLEVYSLSTSWYINWTPCGLGPCIFQNLPRAASTARTG